MIEQFISCPIHSAKNPDFPIRVTQRAIDHWTKGWNYLSLFRSYKMIHLAWDQNGQWPVASEQGAYLPFVETYEKIQGLRISYAIKEKELLRGAILDYADWPIHDAEPCVWMDPNPAFPGASDPGRLTLSDERLAEIHPELMGDPPTFMQWLQGWGTSQGQGYVHDVIAKNLWVGDTRAVVVMKCNPLIVAAYLDDFKNVILFRFEDSFAEQTVQRLNLQEGSRLVAVHTFIQAGSIADDLNTPANAPHNPWTNCTTNIAEFLSDDTERIKQLHAAIGETEWTICSNLGKRRLKEKVPCRDGRPWLSHLTPKFQKMVKYPYGEYAPEQVEG